MRETRGIRDITMTRAGMIRGAEIAGVGMGEGMGVGIVVGIEGFFC